MARADLDFKVVVTGQEKLEKLYKNVDKVDQAAKKAQGTLPKASNNIRGFGKSAIAAATGIKTMDGAIKAALGPITALMAGVAGLSAAFKTIAGQDFAVAKVKTLGVNSDELVGNLKQVSKELNGSASVAELTGAAYDVASAGFTDAADNAKVLKAAALGAAGGFTDMNTAGNALTSVLNAYGLAASDAEKIMDQFVQTQNDGKIVVAEYARNISKVAPVAAGLGIELAEVNAIISQVTAGGTAAEVAFTGLKTALAQLASGNANKALKQLGIEVTTADLKSKGLIGVLREIEASGVDVGTAFKAFGNEAAPVLQAVFNDIDKTNKLLENQENSVGVAAKAHSTATDTIQGAWKRITTVFENFFSDQTAVGTLIKEVMNEAAVLLEAVAGSLNLVLLPFKKMLEFILWVRSGIQKLATAFGEALKNSEGFKALQAIFAQMQPILSAIGKQFQAVIGPAFETLLKWAGMLADVLGKIVMQWLDGMIKGMVELGKIIPFLGDKARDMEKGWEKIKAEIKKAAEASEKLKKGAKEGGDEVDEADEKAKDLEKTLAAIGNNAKAMWEFVQEMPSGFAEANLSAQQLELAAKGVTQSYKEQTAELQRQHQATESLANLQFTLGQERLKTEMALNQVLLQSAQRQLDGAKTAEARQQAAKDIYDITVQQAKLEFQATRASILESVRKVEAQRDLLKLKAKEIEAEVQLAKAKGVATDEHLKAVQLANDAVDLATKQLTLQEQIAGQQMLQAQAVYEGKIAAAEAAFEQNKVFEATKGAANQAERFANNMSKAANNAQAAAASASGAANSFTAGGSFNRWSSKFGAAANDPYFMSQFSKAYNAIYQNNDPRDPFNGKRFDDLYETYESLAAQYNQKYYQQKQEREKEAFDEMMYGNSGGGGGSRQAFASGGYATRPSVAGEGAEDEYVIPSSKMGAAMARYRAGARGDDVIPTAADVVVNYGGTTMTMDGTSYVQQDDVTGIVNKAVSQTLSTLRKSSRARLEAGIR